MKGKDGEQIDARTRNKSDAATYPPFNSSPTSCEDIGSKETTTIPPAMQHVDTSRNVGPKLPLVGPVV